ncbi:DUF1659 domain-containing protein [Jeotgalibacillus campisalis]|uniref:DUF1659 domain-containing protein n=1 Tax=Jeotgalibacillus campisalis TaxID=220754 RepID=A0A0C2W3F9_9BACL|nr:DUF1659 domain-containing protein [Jeotgalibacillus campisalis]KIL51161.1 hypothetical protein KR50_10420 [Jeotgalibacillus campisalis]
MAVSYVSDVKLRLVFEDGLKQDGTPVLKRKTLSRIRFAATADQLHNTAQALSSLCSYSLIDTERVETSGIQPF